MKLAHLKRLRVIVSLLFFLPITLLFIDFQNYYVSSISEYVLYFQFLPSLVKFINLLTFFSIGFIIILVLTFLFGRVYCSCVCPMGTLQDLIIKISNRKKLKKSFEFSNPKNYWRYSFLTIAIVFLVSGSMFGINLLDPFSSYGKIITNIFRQLFMFLNNLISSLLEQFDNYSILPIELKEMALMAFTFAVLIFGIVLWLSVKHGRLYCNSVCPVGTFLGLISKYSLFKISVDENNCISCGECELVCKANCIDSENKFVDFSRCINCYNCFDSCPTNGLVYKHEMLNVKGETRKGKKQINQFHNKDEKEVDNNRRNFVRQTVLYSFGLSILAKAQEKIEVYVKNKTPINRLNPISPPGSKGIEHFTDSCTACHLCVSVCPTQVLQPSFLEYGFLGMMQPRMDNKASFCNYDCIICTEVCPSGAILPLGLEEKKIIQIGKAKFVKENCVVETQKTNCGACAEHCPTKAVHMVPYNKIKIPEVDEEICIGCGACEFACPTIPYKAIYVEGNSIHQAAKKPQQKELEKKVDLKEEFPF